MCKNIWNVSTTEKMDNSMLIVTKVPTHTGHFYYDKTPTLRHTSTGETLYGIYEYEHDGKTYVWCSTKFNSKCTRLKSELELIIE